MTSRVVSLDRHLYWDALLGTDWLRRVTIPVSRATDKLVVWVGMGAALALAPNHVGRRAATRALAYAGIASGLANGPVKGLARRARPAGAVAATRLQGMRAPRTTSFPSGHTATAFGFAMGAGQELSALASPLLALATFLGFSRVHTGLHYPSDVIGGALIGVGVGLVGRRIGAQSGGRTSVEAPS